MTCGVHCRRGSDPALLWLWCRPADAALIQRLAWEPPYTIGTALKEKKNFKLNVPLMYNIFFHFILKYYNRVDISLDISSFFLPCQYLKT